MSLLTILYGTQTGNAERLALRVSRLALLQGFNRVSCQPADDVPIEEWVSTGGPVLLICSNANQGEAPDSFRRSWASLLQPTTADAMKGLQYAVFGLGDSLYLKFNYMAKMLHNRLQQLGGTPLVMRGLGDESDAKGVEEVLQPWLSELWAALGMRSSVAAASNGVSSAHPLQKLPFFPLFAIRMHADADGGPAPSSQPMASSPIQEGTDSVGVPFSVPVFACEVVRNERITAADCAQAVHHLELRVEEGGVADSGYEVGDALGIYSPNRQELVEELLQRLGLDGSEVVEVTPDSSHGLVRQPKQPFFHRPLSLRTLLFHYIDLDAVVTQEFLWMLAHEVSGDDDDARDIRERLYELADPCNVNDYLQYAHREKRNVCEVLYDFANLRPSLEGVLSFVTPMRPRYFSIASAPALDGLGTFQLCVGKLDWHTPLRRHRTGLCSSFLVNAAPGTRLMSFVWQGSLVLPSTPAPLLCIATGTGIAPIRSLLRQVAALPEPGWKEVPLMLVFGCRHEAEDYLYAAEWVAMREQGALPRLQVVTAFSRDSDKKIYVQHRLGQHARLVSAFLQPQEEGIAPGVVYVCGNAKTMPKDVQRTLQQIVEATVAGMEGEGNAAMYIRRLERVGRYQTDTWSA